MSVLQDVSDLFAGLGEFAVAGTITQNSAGAYNPATGQQSGRTPTVTPIVVALSATSMKTLGFKYGQQGLIQVGDIEAFLPAKGITIEVMPGDVVSAGGTNYRIVLVRPEFTGATPVFYSCVVRK